MNKMLCKVKWFNKEKGFGFLAPVDGGKDIFCHHSALRKANLQDLVEGQRVEIDVEDAPKGPNAINLRLV